MTAACEYNHGSFFHLESDEKKKMLEYQNDPFETFGSASSLTALPSALKKTPPSARDLKPTKRVSFALSETRKEHYVDESFETGATASLIDNQVIQDMEAAKAAVLFMGVSENLVQLVIDTQPLEPRHQFSNAEQLYKLVDELANDPQRQSYLHMKLYQHQQAAETSSGKAGTSKIQDGVKDNTSNVRGDCQKLPAGMSEESCQSTTTSSSSCPSSSCAAAASHNVPEHLMPEMVEVSGAAKGASSLPTSMTTVARADNGCRSAHHEDNMEQDPEINPANPSNVQEPMSDITKTLIRMELQGQVKKLAAEKMRLTKRKMCRACKKIELSSSGVTFLPCGHFITCEVCSETFDDCPACGKVIMGTVRTFLS